MDELENQGHKIVITIRDFAQVIQLCDRFKISYNLIGMHGGKSKFNKLSNFVLRVSKLVTFANNNHFDIALSCGSYFQILAAKMLRIQAITFLDYEYQPAYHLAFKFADKIILPSVFPQNALSHFKANLGKIRKYNGIKEQIYLSSFSPNPNFLKEIGLDEKKIIVTVRPPPTNALYHDFENPLFYKALDFLDKYDKLIIIALPRDNSQKKLLLRKQYKHMFIPDKAIDGKNLVYYSDLVISAGGTMNREAAILGTPAYSMYVGRIGAMDRYLIDTGRIISLKNHQDINFIKLDKKSKTEPLLNKNLLKEVIGQITKTN